MLHQDLTDSNNPTRGVMLNLESCGFNCILLISQVFTGLPFFNDNFQTNYNPRNLGVSTSEIQVVYKFSKGYSVTGKSSRIHLVADFEP